jgi:DNA-binding transcriptional ArsR family regulator
MQTTDATLDRVFQALSASTRRSILMQIREQDETVNNIASKFQISLPAVSKHLKVLEQAGLISRRKDGRKRICRAEPALMSDAMKWLEFYQSFWNQRLSNLKQFIEQNNH